MAFTQTEQSECLEILEREFWRHRRPPLHLRDRIREGQRIEGQDIELFFVRPIAPGSVPVIEDSIARIRYVRSRKIWRLFWMRADGRWHAYPPCRETRSLRKALQVILEDENCCFFG